MARFAALSRASWATLEIGCAMTEGPPVAKFELCPGAVVLSSWAEKRRIWLVVDGFVAIEVSVDEMARFAALSRASWATLEIGCAMTEGPPVAKFKLCAGAVVLSSWAEKRRIWLVVDGFVAIEVSVDEMARFAALSRASWATLEIGCAMTEGPSVVKFELCAGAVVLSSWAEKHGIWLAVDGFLATEVRTKS